MSDEIIAFVRRCLDDDERVAREATPGPWVWSREYVTPPGYHHRDIGPLEPGDSAHIARWDPARVLAEVEAKRRILELHARDHECSTYSDLEPGEIESCNWVLDGDCSTIALLAQPYAGHEGWREEWCLDR